MAESNATFRTKTGLCRVGSDLLNLERHGLRGRAAQALQGDSKARTFLVYAAIAAGTSYVAWSHLRAGNTTEAAMFGSLAGWLALSLVRARDFSVVNQVARARTDRIEFVRGVFGLTRDRIVVHFRDDAGKPARRFILMPGIFQQGRGELEHARRVLAQHGWL